MMLFPHYLWHALMTFHQTFVGGASWEVDELIRYNIKGKGYTGCLQLLEIYWNLKALLNILYISLNLMVLLEIFGKMIDHVGFRS